MVFSRSLTVHYRTYGSSHSIRSAARARPVHGRSRETSLRRRIGETRTGSCTVEPHGPARLQAGRCVTSGMRCGRDPRVCEILRPGRFARGARRLTPIRRGRCWCWPPFSSHGTGNTAYGSVVCFRQAAAADPGSRHTFAARSDALRQRAPSLRRAPATRDRADTTLPPSAPLEGDLIQSHYDCERRPLLTGAGVVRSRCAANHPGAITARNPPAR